MVSIYFFHFDPLPGDDLTNAKAEVQVHVLHLSNEDGGHDLVQSGPVHVDLGADGEYEPGDVYV